MKGNCTADKEQVEVYRASLKSSLTTIRTRMTSGRDGALGGAALGITCGLAGQALGTACWRKGRNSWSSDLELAGRWVSWSSAWALVSGGVGSLYEAGPMAALFRSQVHQSRLKVEPAR